MATNRNKWPVYDFDSNLFMVFLNKFCFLSIQF